MIALKQRIFFGHFKRASPNQVKIGSFGRLFSILFPHPPSLNSIFEVELPI